MTMAWIILLKKSSHSDHLRRSRKADRVLLRMPNTRSTERKKMNLTKKICRRLLRTKKENSKQR